MAQLEHVTDLQHELQQQQSAMDARMAVMTDALLTIQAQLGKVQLMLPGAPAPFPPPSQTPPRTAQPAPLTPTVGSAGAAVRYRFDEASTRVVSPADVTMDEETAPDETDRHLLA